MKITKITVLLIALILGIMSSQGVTAHPTHGTNDSRSDADKSRDMGRKPADILKFYGIKPGMTVIEYGSGSGYYTQLLSQAVGEKGKVYAQNSPRRPNDKLKALLKKLPNAEGVFVNGSDLDLPENSVDAAFIILIFHHMHYNKKSPDVLPETTIKTLANIHSSLKPGGVLAIIEHAAVKGTGRADSAALHRIEADTTIADITAQGFTYAGSSDVLHFEADDRTKHFRQGGKRDSSWRLVQKYVKK